MAAGTTQAAIARHCSRSTASVHKVIEGKMRNDAIEKALTEIIGRPPFDPPTPRVRSGGRKKSVFPSENTEKVQEVFKRLIGAAA